MRLVVRWQFGRNGRAAAGDHGVQVKLDAGRLRRNDGRVVDLDLERVNRGGNGRARQDRNGRAQDRPPGDTTAPQFDAGCALCWD